MAEKLNGSAAATTDSTTCIPIAQLTPLLVAPASRSLKAVVTLTWPYSSATGSVAFLLAEPDFRLRRTKGQVRVQFSGSSAKTVAKSGIASGDVVILCLDGVEFVHDETTISTPGRGVDFELRFTERLLLQFRQEESQNTNIIDIDHPDPEPELSRPPRISTPESESPEVISTNGTAARTEIGLAADEFSSPAFIKRARTSYGSLFEGDLEADDGTVKGKGRKRTRLSSAWRYASRSPTPEMDAPEPSGHNYPEQILKPTPMMTDEGVQTTGLDDDAAEALAEFARQSTNIGRHSYKSTNGTVLVNDDATSDENETSTSHTRFPENKELQSPSFGHPPPLSPRIQPLPSENLALVSPLVSQKLGTFSEHVGSNGTPMQSQSFQERLSAPNGSALQTSEEGQDDIYSASPAGHDGEQLSPGFQSFQDHNAGFNGTGASDIEGHDPPEDQYGHWQSEVAQMSYVASPHRSEKAFEEDEDNQFPIESQSEETYHNHGLTMPHEENELVQQYPDLDDVMSGNQLSSTWGHGAESFAYPELPNHGDNLDSLVRSLSQPRSTAMSRSVSAHSAVVDLTESSGEEDNEEYEEEGRSQQVDGDKVQKPENHMPSGSNEEEDYEGSVEEYDEDEEQQVDVAGRRHFAQREEIGDRHSERSEDGEYYSEDEIDEEGNPYPLSTYHAGREHFEDDEEEASYDEDDEMEDDEPRPPAQGDPVVIDLLSSDEEGEEEDIPARQPAASTAQQTGLNHSESEASAEDESERESDEDIDDESAGRRVEHSGPPSAKQKVYANQSEGEDSEEESIESVEDESDDSRRTEHRRDVVKAQERDDSEDRESEASNGNEGTGSSEEYTPELTLVDQVEVNGGPGVEQENQTQNSEGIQESIKVEVGTSENPNVDPPVGQYTRGTFHEIPSLSTRVVSLDSANDERQHKEHQSAQEPSEMETGGFEAHAGKHLKKRSQDRPSLFARMFNLDGANDEPDGEISYPALPSIEPSPPATASASESQQLSHNAQEQGEEPRNAQLLTPDATQLTEKMLSQESSFASAPGFPVSDPEDMNEISGAATIEASSKPGAENVEPHLERVEPVQATEDTTKPEMTSITVDTENVTIEEGSKDEPDAGNIEETLSKLPIASTKTQQQTGHANLLPEEPIFTAESPRRSHRRVKSITTAVKSKENIRPVTPIKSVKSVATGSMGSEHGSPMVVTDELSTPKGHDASIELALSSLESPSKHHDLRRPPVTDLKLRLTRNLRTELEEFTALKVLRYHLNQKLDVLAIATTTPPEPQRAKSGPRHYLITFNITDPSVAPSGVTEVQVFRPYKEALPIVKVGDGILLRNFQVISVKNRGFALRSETEASSWAVFKDSDEAEVRGPPVEYGNGEKNHITQMKVWFENLDSPAMVKLNRANADKSATAGVGAGIADRKSMGKAF